MHLIKEFIKRMLKNALRVLINNLFQENFDIIFIKNEKNCQNIKDMFGNYFFPLFSVSKNNFLFLRLKNLIGNIKWIENKKFSQNSIGEGN